MHSINTHDKGSSKLSRYHSPKVSHPNATCLALKDLKRVSVESEGQAAHEAPLSAFVYCILVLPLSFKPRSPYVLLQFRYSKVGLEHPIKTYSLHSPSSFKSIDPCPPRYRKNNNNHLICSKPINQ